MATLYLLRHARAVWPQPGMRDFDRELDATGLNDAVALGIHMARQGYFPESIVCSTARRARDTLRELMIGMDATLPVDFTDELYTRDAAGYLDLLRQQTGNGPILFVGHNPMIEDAAIRLIGVAYGGYRERLEMGFPVCGLAVVDLPGQFAETMPGSGALIDFITP